MSTKYAEYKDAVNGRDRLELATGTGGIKLTMKWFENEGPRKIRKFWLTAADAEELGILLKGLARGRKSG